MPACCLPAMKLVQEEDLAVKLIQDSPGSPDSLGSPGVLVAACSRSPGV